MSGNTAPGNLQEKMRALKAHFVQQLATRMAEIEPLLARCHAGDVDADGRALLQHHAHKLAGTGATYGFPAISEAGSTLEYYLIDHPDAPVQDWVHYVVTLVEACRAAMDSASPTADTPPNAEAPAATNALPAILVLDDDPIIALTVRKMFQGEAEIRPAATLEDAQAALKQGPVKLLLIDRYLGLGLTGMTVLASLRTMPEVANIPAVLLSADGTPLPASEAASLGIVAQLEKPLDVACGVVRIRAHMQP